MPLYTGSPQLTGVFLRMIERHDCLGQSALQPALALITL